MHLALLGLLAAGLSSCRESAGFSWLWCTASIGGFPAERASDAL